MKKFKVTWKSVLLIAIGVAINYGLFLICNALHMPFWMDITGTALVSIIGGVIPGVIVAIVSEVLLVVFHFGWASMLYVFVGIAIAIIFGLIAKAGKINSTLAVFGMVLIGMLVKVTVSVVIAILIGEPPANEYEFICYNAFVDADFSSTYAFLLSTFITNIPDAIGTALITFGGYRLFNLIGFLKSKEEKI